MKNIFRTYFLATLLVAVPAVLIGCSGGRSNNFNSTNASLRFSSVSGEGPQTRPLNVGGAITREEQLQNPNGTLVIRFAGAPNITGSVAVAEATLTPSPTVTPVPTPEPASVVASFSTQNGITRILGFGAFPFDALDPSGYPTFTITEESENVLSLYVEAELPSETNEGELYGILPAVSGTIRLISTNGPFVTYRFDNVRFGDSEFGFTANGTITYDRRNVIDGNAVIGEIDRAKAGSAKFGAPKGANAGKSSAPAPKTFSELGKLFGLN